MNTEIVFFGNGVGWGVQGSDVMNSFPINAPLHLQVTCVCHGKNFYFPPNYRDLKFIIVELYYYHSTEMYTYQCC